MASFVSHTTIDCLNAYELSEWWKPVLGHVDLDDDPNEPGHEECMIRDPESGHQVLFIEVPDPTPGKPRIHLDLRPRERSRDEEVEWLLEHGATRRQTTAVSTVPAAAGSPSQIPRGTCSASCDPRRSWPPRPERSWPPLPKGLTDIGEMASRSGVRAATTSEGDAMAGKTHVLIIVQNLPVPLDRRVWLECQALRRRVRGQRHLPEGARATRPAR